MAQLLPAFHAILRMPDGTDQRIAAAQGQQAKVAISTQATESVMATLAPQLDRLQDAGLVTGYNVLSALGMVLIQVDPNRVSEAQNALAALPQLTGLTQEYEANWILESGSDGLGL